MGGLSIWHILIVGLLFVLLFGKGKVSDLMGDVAKGIKSFKKALADDDDELHRPAQNTPPVINQAPINQAPSITHAPQPSEGAGEGVQKDEAGKH